MMQHYNTIIQVEFERPRVIPPQPPHEEPRLALGYFQQFFSTEASVKKSKDLIRDYLRHEEPEASAYNLRFSRIATIEDRESLERLMAQGKTKRDTPKREDRGETGIWYYGEKSYYTNPEESAALTLIAEMETNEEDDWPGYDGQCQACDAYGRVDDMSLCDECAGKFERDMIRQRQWDYSASAFALPVEFREGLRSEVIRKYGSKLELIAPSPQPEKGDTKRRRKGKKR
ncbi:MAG: hypothetical protein DKINENOH_01573 [bacterium]|nr:hypothetical protein [bacterium]